MNCHEAIDLIGDAIEGTLAPEALTGLDEHFAECPPCRNYMDQIRVTRQALGHLSAPGEAFDRNDLIARFKREFRQDS